MKTEIKSILIKRLLVSFVVIILLMLGIENVSILPELYKNQLQGLLVIVFLVSVFKILNSCLELQSKEKG